MTFLLIDIYIYSLSNFLCDFSILLFQKIGFFSSFLKQMPLKHDIFDENGEAIQKQIVLGGLRLAHVIKTIYGSASESPVETIVSTEDVTFLQ